MVFDFRLKVFQTVAQKMSFTKAASELFITQPAVTKHIHELEQQLGTALFKRNGNSISITSSGEILFKYSEKIFELYADLEVELAERNNISGGTLRIGASTTIANFVLPKLLALYKKANPSVNFSFIQGNTDFITQQLIEEKIDIGMVEGHVHYPQIAYETFMKDEIVLVTRANSSLGRQAEIEPAQLLNIPLVLREQGSGTLEVIFKALNGVKINPKNLLIETQLESSVSIKHYLLYSDAAAFLSIQSVSRELKNNELNLIEIPGLAIFRTFQFIQLHGNSSKLVDSFKRFCLKHYNLK